MLSHQSGDYEYGIFDNLIAAQNVAGRALSRLRADVPFKSNPAPKHRVSNECVEELEIYDPIRVRIQAYDLNVEIATAIDGEYQECETDRTYE
jgi:hypothetical protein